MGSPLSAPPSQNTWSRSSLELTEKRGYEVFVVTDPYRAVVGEELARQGGLHRHKERLEIG